HRARHARSARRQRRLLRRPLSPPDDRGGAGGDRVVAEMERHEDEGAKAFDPRLARRLLGYLRPYRARAALSVFLVILSSIFEIAGPAITAIGIDLYIKPLNGADQLGVSKRIGDWLASHGWSFDPITGINVAAVVYLLTLLGGFAILYSQMVLMNLMGQYIMYDLRKQ